MDTTNTTSPEQTAPASASAPPGPTMSGECPPSGHASHEPEAVGGAAGPGPNGALGEPATQTGAPAGAPTGAPAGGFSDELNAEIDAAMAHLGMGPAGAQGRGQGQGGEDKGRRRDRGRGQGGQGGGGGGGGGGGRPPVDPHAHDVPVIGGVQKPAMRGPRVVQAGREHRTGKVVSVGPTDIFLEFGPKELGVAQRAQWPEDQAPAVGQDLEIVVDRFEPGESLFICSRPGAVVKAAWEGLEIGQIVEARVTGVNKGGLELEVAQHRAFMPASQVSLDRVEDLSVFVGEKFPCMVSQLDRRGKGNIVLSRRDILQQERVEKASKLKESLHEGDVIEGTVRKIMPFGAFVDVGGLDGLVHLSDLTYDRVGYGEGAVAKHLKEGQKLTVKVLKLDLENNRLSLGVKQLAGDPFATAANAITEGAEVNGRVTRLTDFGAFVEVSPGVEGLVHVSEIAWRRIGKPADVLQQDQIVKVKVLKIDPQSRKISLSIKATEPMPEPVAAPSGPGGGAGGRGKRVEPKRTVEEIMKEDPSLRRLKEKFGKQQFKGGLS